ncbi:MAG: glucosamine-6-phosphate deaminase [Brevinema sp.]
MQILIKENRSDIIQSVATLIAEKINASNRNFVLGLSTGLTILDICEALTQKVNNHELSLKNVIIFVAGEYVGFNIDDPNFYLKKLKEVFLSKVDVLPENIHTLNGKADDLVKESDRYETLINSVGGMDLFLGSLGSNGNVAFNEPSSSLKGRTRLKTLTTQTIKADARFFGNDISHVPAKALTIGMGTIYEAKEIIIAVYGSHKAFAVEHSLEHSMSDSYPASILQMHPSVIFLIDKVAGRFLNKQLL